MEQNGLSTSSHAVILNITNALFRCRSSHRIVLPLPSSPFFMISFCFVFCSIITYSVTDKFMISSVYWTALICKDQRSKLNGNSNLLTSLLFSPSSNCNIYRFDVWCVFVANEGLFPFRQQVTEIIFVLKAISTLMDSLKKTQPENGEYKTVSRIK